MTRNITRELVRGLLPARPRDGHKGTFGHLFIIAGSRGFTGAAKLACEGAGRSGVGLVTLGIPAPLADLMAIALVESMSLPLPSTTEETLYHGATAAALDFATDKTAAVLGPGLSQHPETKRFVHEFVTQCPVPCVIDADGLNALSENPGLLRDCPSPVILTPHPGEMARLLHSSTAEIQVDREASARLLAEKSGCIVALKGQATVVAGPGGAIAVNTTGSAGLAKGGTGDVLAGLLGGLLAQGMDAFDAAQTGVYAHGLAGDLAAAELTQRGMRARDVADYLPAAWRVIEGEPSS